MDATAFVGVIGGIVMWTGLIITLCVIRSLIIQGACMAISEWLVKMSDKTSQERICRWLGDSERILDYLDDIKQKQESS